MSTPFVGSKIGFATNKMSQNSCVQYSGQHDGKIQWLQCQEELSTVQHIPTPGKHSCSENKVQSIAKLLEKSGDFQEPFSSLVLH